MKRTIFLVLALVAAALLVAPAAVAADDPANQTDDDLADHPDADRSITVDPTVSIDDWSHDDGTYHITFNATEDTTAYVLEPIDADEEDAANLETRTVDLEADETRDVSVQADGPVLVVTDTFLDTGDYVVLDSGSDAIIGGPYSEEDIWFAALFTAAGVGATVVTRVLSHLIGSQNGPQRLA